MIIYLDTETTGLYPGQICQLSYIMQSSESIKSRNFFFTVDEMEYSAFMVHGFSPEKLKFLSGGKRFKDYIDVIEKDFADASLIVSHNTAFDFMFLREEFSRLNRVLTIENEFCSMKKTTELCRLSRSRGEGYKYPKLSELCKFLDIYDFQIKNATERFFDDQAGYHDARFDTSAVFLAMNECMKAYDEFSYLKEFL